MDIAHWYPGWNSRGNRRWTALFHSFDVFQRWIRENDKHQCCSALFQRVRDAFSKDDSACFHPSSIFLFFCGKSLTLKEEKYIIYFYETLSFDTFSTANLPPLPILKKIKYFFGKNQLFLKNAQVYLRNTSILETFCGKFAMIWW